MRFGYSITIYFSWIVIYLAIKLFRANGSESREDSLVLLHVLFRHGERTVNGPEELYPKDPYVNETYFPIGLGQLTPTGKRREFAIGEFLRMKYNQFLGPLYYPDVVDARSTDYNRTKMSLELVLAGLFPPSAEQIWHPSLNWQPIPYNYYPRYKDEVLIGVYCPTYLKLYEEVVRSPEVQREVAKNQELFDYISENTGLKITTFEQVYNLFFGLATEEEWGFQLPPWTRKVWPTAILTATIKEYFIATSTLELKRMACGYFLQKIMDDTIAKIHGFSRGKKIYLYSAHESNIAELLIVLGLFKNLHVPPYGSFIIFEVHRIKNSYAIKLYYQNYDTKEPKLLKLPNCDYVCDFKKFIVLTEKLLPTPGLCDNGVKAKYKV